MTDQLPEGFVVRAPNMRDIPAITQLLQTCEVADDGDFETTESHMRANFQSPTNDPTSDAWLVFAPNEQLAGRAALTHSEHVRMYTTPRVHPAYCHLGIGTYLLHRAEARARQLIENASKEMQFTMCTWCSGNNASANQLLLQEGYRLVKSQGRMGITLSSPPVSLPLPEQLILRTFTPGLEQGLFDLLEKAFIHHWGRMPGNFEIWKYWTIQQEDFDPTLWFLAYKEDELIACALCEYEESRGWIDQVAVRHDWPQKEEVGRVLLLQALGEFYQRGTMEIAGIDIQNFSGVPDLYQKVGMCTIRQRNEYVKEL